MKDTISFAIYLAVMLFTAIYLEVSYGFIGR